MEEKERQITEMAITLSPLCDEEDIESCEICNRKGKEMGGEECIYREQAEELYNVGYRKQSEVIKECASWLKEHAYYDEQWQLVDAFYEHFGEDEQ